MSEKKPKKSVFAGIRNNFIAGIVVLIPIGITFITLDNEYIHRIIVTALIIVGISNVNPSALFAKLFDAVPKATAKTKNK